MTITSDDIRRMFSRLAPGYDRFNRWSSLGLDGAWRRRLVARLEPGWRVLDVGCGTGDLSILAAGKGCRVTGLDFSEGMLEVARRRSPDIQWVQAGAERTGLPDGGYDAAVSAYVLRNLYRGGLLEGALREAARVLKPGGKLIFLDLTRPRNALVRWGHGIYMRTALPLVGRAACGDAWPGDYLRSSIQELPPENALRRAFEAAGFKGFQIVPLSGGIVSLFIADK